MSIEDAVQDLKREVLAKRPLEVAADEISKEYGLEKSYLLNVFAQQYGSIEDLRNWDGSTGREARKVTLARRRLARLAQQMRKDGRIK